jgi:cytidylate kinase
LVITIDGPVAAGKTSAARQLASRLGFTLLDTGAIYRSLALSAQRSGLEWRDESSMSQLASRMDIRFQQVGDVNRVLLSQDDVTEAIRYPEISQGASVVSALPGVRSALLDLQRQQASNGSVIAEGRDTGTVVFPQADVKFFLTATPQIRAQRRFLELETRGIDADLPAVLQDLHRRDHRDSSRSVAPLVPAPDAVSIDSSIMSAGEVLATMLSCIPAGSLPSLS